MISEPDRRKNIELIEMAREAGARLIPACQVLEISARTYQRWTTGGSVLKDQRPEAIRPIPANKLTPDERQRVLDMCHQEEKPVCLRRRLCPNWLIRVTISLLSRAFIEFFTRSMSRTIGAAARNREKALLLRDFVQLVPTRFGRGILRGCPLPFAACFFTFT